MRARRLWFGLLGTLVLAGLPAAARAQVPIASPLLRVTGGVAFPGLATDATGQFDATALKTQGCADPGWKSEALGYLTPREPIVVCAQGQSPRDFMALPPEKRDHLLKSEGCNGPYCYWTRYVVKTGTGLQSLDTQADFKARYAPVESPEEALSFVLATTARVHVLTQQSLSHATAPVTLVLGCAIPRTTRYQAQVTQIEGTTTKAIGDRYQVQHLISDAYCNGSSSETTAYAVDYEVSKTGELRELTREALYKQSNCPVQ